MKLILKSLKQVEYEINIQSDKITVKDLKIEIEKLYSFDSEQIKLIFNGTMLENQNILSDYKIAEKSTIIMMNTKVKKFENLDKNKSLGNFEEIKPQVKSSNEQVNKSNISQILNDNLTIQINTLIDMGFERTQVEAAVKASNGRIDLAVEYLNNGIPDNINNNRNNNRQRPRVESDITKELKKTAGVIKMLCKDNKLRIFGILDNIKKNDPGLLRLITDYQNEFKTYLDSPITEEDKQNYENLENRADQIEKRRWEKREQKRKEKEEKEKKEKEEKEKEEKEKEAKEKKEKDEDIQKMEEEKNEINNENNEEKKEDKKEEKIEDKKEDKKGEQMEVDDNEKAKKDEIEEVTMKDEKKEDKSENTQKNNEVDNINKNINNMKEEEKKEINDNNMMQIEEDKNNNLNENKEANKNNNDSLNKDNNNNICNNSLINQLTEEEKNIVNRIKSLVDFSLTTVVEAFIVCNKNEELTLNYLFEQYK